MTDRASYEQNASGALLMLVDLLHESGVTPGIRNRLTRIHNLLNRELAARYETPEGPVYGSIDACASVQRKFAWSAPIVTELASGGHVEATETYVVNETKFDGTPEFAKTLTQVEFDPERYRK